MKSVKKYAERVQANLWACIASDGTSDIIEIPDPFNPETYLELLQNQIVPFLREKYPPPREIIFYQDMSSIHTSRLVRDYLESLDNFQLIQVPPNSDDLNPLSEIWEKMMKVIEIVPHITEIDFKAALHTSWELCLELDQSLLKNASRSVPNRLKRIVELKGEISQD